MPRTEHVGEQAREIEIDVEAWEVQAESAWADLDRRKFGWRRARQALDLADGNFQFSTHIEGHHQSRRSKIIARRDGTQTGAPVAHACFSNFQIGFTDRHALAYQRWALGTLEIEHRLTSGPEYVNVYRPMIVGIDDYSQAIDPSYGQLSNFNLNGWLSDIVGRRALFPLSGDDHQRGSAAWPMHKAGHPGRPCLDMPCLDMDGRYDRR